MTAALTLPRTAALCHLPHPFALVHGGALETAHAAFELHGAAGAPVVAVLGGISAGRHVAAHGDDPAAGWWEGVVGPSCAIDTRRFRVLSIDWIGGAGASTPAGPGFPAIDVRDQARALSCVLDGLGIGRLHAVVGASYGGMVGLAFAAEHRERLERVLTIAAAHRPSPSATAWRVLQRRVVRLGLETGRGDDALALARGLAMTSYRGRAELDVRFAGEVERLEDGAFRFPVEDYLDARGRSFARRFTAEAFLCLSESIDLCAVDPRAVSSPATVVGIRGDRLVRPEEVGALAAALGGPMRHVEIGSAFGHDGFLKEVGVLTPVVRAALGAEVRR